MNIVEINLLPVELRPKRRSNMPKVGLLPVISWAALSLFIVYIALVSIGRFEASELKRLNKRWAEMNQSHMRLLELKAQIKQVSDRVVTIEDMLRRRFVWARKLNQLSDTMSKGIWLKEVSLVSKTRQPAAKGEKPKKFYSLVLRGSAVSQDEEETAVIGKFMKDLKDEKEFFADFSDIELNSIQSDKINNRNVMHFTITSYFKDGAIQ